MRLLLLPLLLLAVAASGCDQTDPASAPVVEGIFPYVVVPGSYVYVTGSGFGSSAAGVTVRFRPAEGAAVAGVVVEATDTRLTVRAPSDLPTSGSPLTVLVETSGGVTELVGRPIYGVPSSAFGNDFEPGRGLVGRVYELAPNTPVLPDFRTMTPASIILAPTLDVTPRSFSNGFPGVPGGLVEWFGIRFDSKLTVPTTGTYTFRVLSDDGSKVYIDGDLVLDNDGTHAPQSATGSVALTAGTHDLRVDYFQGPRFQIALQLYWTPPGGQETIIPTSSLPLPDLATILP